MQEVSVSAMDRVREREGGGELAMAHLVFLPLSLSILTFLSMYAAFDPVPKMTPSWVSWSM